MDIGSQDGIFSWYEIFDQALLVANSEKRVSLAAMKN